MVASKKQDGGALFNSLEHQKKRVFESQNDLFVNFNSEEE